MFFKNKTPSGEALFDDVPPLKTSSNAVILSGLLTFIVLFVGLGVWMLAVSIQGAVIASGTVSILGKPKTVQHLDGGIVAEILVENGTRVKAGDVLLRLDDTMLMANLDIYKNRFREAVSLRDRLSTEQQGLTQITWDDEIFELNNILPGKEVREGQNRIFQARQATTKGQVSQLRERIRQLDNQIEGLEALSDSKISQIGILKKEHEAIRSLAKDGYASESRVLTLQRQIEELKGQQFEHKAEISRVRNTISEVRVQITQINREFDQVTITELREAELSIKDMEQQIIATQDQLRRINIQAPIPGVIHEQNIFTLGGVIAPGAIIMQIIPVDKGMEFEVKVEPQNIDQIYAGQKVSVLFSAFNARTTPQLNGIVQSVALNTSVDEELGYSFYTVRVEVADDELKRLGEKQLISGMPIEAFFATESRSPLSYLTKPLTDNIKRAGREE